VKIEFLNRDIIQEGTARIQKETLMGRASESTEQPDKILPAGRTARQDGDGQGENVIDLGLIAAQMTLSVFQRGQELLGSGLTTNMTQLSVHVFHIHIILYTMRDEKGTGNGKGLDNEMRGYFQNKMIDTHTLNTDSYKMWMGLTMAGAGLL
jgi:hypothetical protein